MSDARKDLVDALDALKKARADVHASRNGHQRLLALVDEQLHILTRDANAHELAGCDAIADALRKAAESLAAAVEKSFAAEVAQ
jgi:predicted component of type VI protein secretion system